MEKWYDEEYEFNIEVIGFLRGDHTENYCRSLFEGITMEISYAREREEVKKKIEKMQEEAVTQPQMNETAEEMYQLWDDILNVVRGLLEAMKAALCRTRNLPLYQKYPPISI